LDFSCQDRQEATILANAISVAKLASSMANAISWARDSIQSKMGYRRFDLEVAEKFVVALVVDLRKGSRITYQTMTTVSVEACMMGPSPPMRGYVERRTVSNRSARSHPWW
jgi:hypothetical protein